MIETKFKDTEIGKIPEEWEMYSIGDIGTFSKGSGISRAESNTGNIPAIRYGEIYTCHNDYVKEFFSYISTSVAQHSKMLHYGDILFAASGETKEDIAKAVAFISNATAYAGGDIIVLSPKECFDSKYLGFLLNTSNVIKQRSSKAQGDAVVHITPKSIATIKIALPPFSEQHRIASALTSIDNLISSLAKLIEKKKNIKQGAMQQLLTGKTRLKGFDGAWVERKLGETGSLAMCKRIFQEETSENGDVPFYKIGTFGQQADAYISKEKYEEFKRIYRFPNKGDILISAAGTIGRTVIYDGKPAYFQDSNIVWLAHNENCVINSFLYYVYQRIRWNTEDTTIARLYNNNFNNTIIRFPQSISEQRAIATILTKMDDEITALAAKKAKYEAVKQGMMQQLLTGKLRLIG